MKIYGAGLAGLIAACHFPQARIFESKPEGEHQHKALLRFRSPAVGDAVGVDFRRVSVHKGIWHDGRFAAPDIRLHNWYARKVAGKLVDRSIWNVETADRWVAPEDFHAQLAERHRTRIEYGFAIDTYDFIRADGEVVISTLPMPDAHEFLVDGFYHRMPDFLRSAPVFPSSPIQVRRFRVKGANVHQTVYFPDPVVTLYRASIVGDLLIAEYVDAANDDSAMALDAFGLSRDDVEPVAGGFQPIGKIAPTDEVWRKEFIYWLSREHHVYSLGRFATWRNVMLDDVLNDIRVIHKLINSCAYEHALSAR